MTGAHLSPPARTSRGMRRLLAVALGLALLGYGVHACSRSMRGHSVFLSKTAAVSRLDAVLRHAAVAEVEEFRDQDWCRVLRMPGAGYRESSHPPTCGFAPEPWHPFDAHARSRHAQIARLLARTGVAVHYFTRTTDAAGTLQAAEFSLDACSFCRVSYVYRADAEPAPQPGPEGEVVERPIAPHWVERIEDWN